MTVSELRMQHTSLQATDSKRQQIHDANVVFSLGRALPIKSGTESGPETYLREALKEAAKEHNHRIHFTRGNFIAIDRAIIKDGTYKTGSRFVAKNSRVVGPGHDLAYPTVRFQHVNEGIGEVNVASIHLATKGARPGDPNYHINGEYIADVTRWMHEAGRGDGLAFLNGDFNSKDNVNNWPRDKKSFTSMGDELGYWPNTGHGPIDGFCSYNKDGRVSAKHLRVLNDEALHLFSDHFCCRGTWAIQHRKGK